MPGKHQRWSLSLVKLLTEKTLGGFPIYLQLSFTDEYHGDVVTRNK